MSAYRLAGVTFSNAYPLLEGLADEGVQVLRETPARCTDLLRAGEADLALLPVVEMLRSPDLVRLSRGAVATCGRCRTVLLVSDRPLRAIERVRLSPASRTSNALVRLLFAGWRNGSSPRFLEADPGAPLLEEGIARVVIGDPAFEAARQAPHVYQLAAAWREQTGLPFVFACFAGRRELLETELPDLLDRARRRNLGRLDEIIARTARELRQPEEEMRAYFREDLHYELTPEDEEGLAVFARRLGLRGGAA